MTKLSVLAGQSNGLYFVATDLPTGGAKSRVARASADLGSNTGPLPMAWGPTDPYGFQARLVAEFTAGYARVDQPGVLWFQGEQDATGMSTHYGPDFLGLVARIDALTGRSDTIWGVVQLNIAFAGDSPAAAIGTPRVRAGEAWAVSVLGPQRAFLINVDDIPPLPNQHYLPAQYPIIWGRYLTGMVNATGDATWAL